MSLFKQSSIAFLFIISLVIQPIFFTSSYASNSNVTPSKHTKKKLSKPKSNIQRNLPDPIGEAHAASSFPYSRAQLMRLPKKELEYLPFDLDVPGEAFVSTGPYVGVSIQFAGSDLIVNSPSVNTDVQLLNIRKDILSQLRAMGGTSYTEPYHSHLLLSGLIETQAGYFKEAGSPSRTDIDLSSVSVDMFVIGPSNWLLGFAEFNYDDGRSHFGDYRVAYSRVFVNKAFVTIGNFSESPWYGTAGQFYVPFGTYSSVMVSAPLTKILGRTKARAIEIGYQQQSKQAFYGSAYIFRGDSHAASVSKVNNGGINIGYRFANFCGSGNVGGGIIANIADSAGLQIGNGFEHFEQLHHRVPAYDLRASLDIGEHINLIGEYIGTAKEFNLNDMSYNGHGAQPSALDLEAAYSNYLWDRPVSVGIGYTKSDQALSLDIPLTRYSLVFNTSIWRNTLQSLEFRVDRNYAASDSGNGPVGAQTSVGSCTSLTCAQNGGINRAVTAQFDYYF